LDKRPSEALGIFGNLMTGSMREDQLNFGMFLDLGGRDVYEGESDGRNGVRALGNNTLITQKQNFKGLNLRGERAVFLDGEYSPNVLRLAPLTLDKEPAKAKSAKP